MSNRTVVRAQHGYGALTFIRPGTLSSRQGLRVSRSLLIEHPDVKQSLEGITWSRTWTGPWQRLKRPLDLVSFPAGSHQAGPFPVHRLRSSCHLLALCLPQPCLPLFPPVLPLPRHSPPFCCFPEQPTVPLKADVSPGEKMHGAGALGFLQPSFCVPSMGTYQATCPHPCGQNSFCTLKGTSAHGSA
ncbi:hypothetical protein P7K49_024635 [Saguinus oedipus]|uniref:Uncharacterized protein n=1 Tax=Saguinus oedipus TaxID=9490 RepID=A0ABQ9UQ25_SAGOE|nr:hypothetical protein P7K49_024635 [Saguinus oedipus]